MPSNLNYWFYMATFYLIWLTIQDYRNKMMVDDRKNWFMMGLSISIISHIRQGLLYRFGLIFLNILFIYFFRKAKGFGEADINTLGWIFLGFGLIDIYYLLYFYIIFTILTITYYLIKNQVFKYKAPIQFYGVILLSFVLNSLLIGGYSWYFFKMFYYFMYRIKF